MAEIPNLPSGAVPPKPAEAAKVQPKKETVRINLPPKPTASPTIKLPTLPTGVPPPKTSGAAAPVAAPATGPKPPTPPTGGAPASRVAGLSTAQRSAAPSPTLPAPRQAPAPVYAISGLDKGLAIGAAIVSLLAAATVAWLAFMLTNQTGI
ncbi:MAG: hypothetical protein ABIR24_00615 [Verrucomicrobiota bacterium]